MQVEGSNRIGNLFRAVMGLAGAVASIAVAGIAEVDTTITQPPLESAAVADAITAATMVDTGALTAATSVSESVAPIAPDAPPPAPGLRTLPSGFHLFELAGGSRVVAQVRTQSQYRLQLGLEGGYVLNLRKSDLIGVDGAAPRYSGHRLLLGASASAPGNRGPGVGGGPDGGGRPDGGGASDVACPSQGSGNALAGGNNDSLTALTQRLSATRYFYGPSSYNIPQGQWLFSQKELFFSSVAYGLTDHLSVQVGSVLPALFVEEGANVILGAKAGIDFEQKIGFQAGVQAFFVEDQTLWLPFGGVTLGSPEAHFSLNVALPADEEGSEEAVWFMPAGELVANQRFSILGEAIIGGEGFLGLLGVRIRSGRISSDIGAVLLEGAEMPLPWLDISYFF